MHIFITQKLAFDFSWKSIDSFIYDTDLHHKLSFGKIKTLKKIKSNNDEHKIYLTIYNGQIHFKNLATFIAKYVRIFWKIF